MLVLSSYPMGLPWLSVCFVVRSYIKSVKGDEAMGRKRGGVL